jgi:glucose-6-phosphate dehydrogenase assembly protein OpcA
VTEASASSAGQAAAAPEGAEADSSRWHVRAHSIRDCVNALGAIWTSAAEQAGAAPMPASARERALADPHLAGRLEARGEVRVRMRTSVLTLVVVAPRPETAERAMAAVSALNQRHPSRAIVVSPGDFDGPPSTDAHIYATCQLSPRSEAEVCTERILLKVGGELSAHLARVVSPLLIHDLPVVLWWPDDPAFGTRQFQEVVSIADRLLVDSGGFAQDGSSRLAGLASVAADGIVVSDIGWLRLNLWRELLAGLFDHPLLTPELDHVVRVRVDFSRPSATLRLAKAAYTCGWLASRLGWDVSKPVERDEDDVFRGTYRRGRREIAVELRPTRVGLDTSPHSAGSLLCVEVECARPRTTLRARVTRQHDHLLATADWNGAQVARRAGRLEPFDETPYIAEALEHPGLDPVFERALVRAVRLIGG